MEDETTTTESKKTYYELTESQAAAVKALLDGVGELIKENYADLMGAKNAMETPADVIPDTREEQRTYAVQVSVEVPDVEMEIDVNDHIDSYMLDTYTVKDSIESETGMRPEGYEVNSANFDYYSSVDLNLSASYRLSLTITVPATTEVYCDLVQELLDERFEEAAPDLTVYDYSIYDYTLEDAEPLSKAAE